MQRLFLLGCACLFTLSFPTFAQSDSPDLTTPRAIITPDNAPDLVLLASLPLPAPPGMDRGTASIAFSPDSRLLMTTQATAMAARTTHLWHLRSGQRHAVIEHAPTIGVPVFDPHGVALAAVVRGDEGSFSIVLWDVETGRAFYWAMQPPPEPRERSCSPPNMAGVIFTPDSALLSYGIQFCHRTLRTWNARTGELLPIPEAFAWRSLILTDVRGRLLALYEFNGITELRSLLDDRPFVAINHESQVGVLALPPAGDRLAYAEIDSPVVTVLDLATGAVQTRFSPPVRLLNSLAFHPEGRLLVSTGVGSQSVGLWQADDGAFVTGLHRPLAVEARFSPDGTLLAVVTNGGISLYGVPAP